MTDSADSTEAIVELLVTGEVLAAAAGMPDLVERFANAVEVRLAGGVVFDEDDLLGRVEDIRLRKGTE